MKLTVSKMTAHVMKDIVQGEHSSIADGSGNWYSHYENQYGDPSENWESINPPQDPLSHTTLGHIPMFINSLSFSEDSMWKIVSSHSSSRVSYIYSLQTPNISAQNYTIQLILSLMYGKILLPSLYTWLYSSEPPCWQSLYLRQLSSVAAENLANSGHDNPIPHFVFIGDAVSFPHELHWCQSLWPAVTKKINKSCQQELPPPWYLNIFLLVIPHVLVLLSQWLHL